MKKKIDFVPNRFLRSVPNALTLCNSICGFVAILYTLKAYEIEQTGQTMNVFYVSAIMIFSAMIFDAMDGFAARLLNAASVHGIQMDSLSDMVTFGVAPAVLVAVMTHSLRQWSLAGWQEVRNGEEKYVFPCQDNADVIFNTFLAYELAVLNVYAEPLLYKVTEDDPEYITAIRLIKLLDLVLPMPSDDVPSVSILREFIGKSYFE
jgi:hypothetical protein